MEDEADAVAVEADIERGLVVVVFPEDVAVFRVEAEEFQEGGFFQAGGEVAGHVIDGFVVGLDGVEVGAGDVAGKAAGLGGPEATAGLGVDF